MRISKCMSNKLFKKYYNKLIEYNGYESYRERMRINQHTIISFLHGNKAFEKQIVQVFIL